LALGISKNKSIKHLDFSENQNHFFQSRTFSLILSNMKLLSFNISSTIFSHGNSSFNCNFENISLAGNISYLDFSNCRIRKGCLNAIIKNLFCQKIYALNLNFNEISDESKDALNYLLLNNMHLKELQLEGNNLSEVTFCDIEQGLSTSNLEFLNLSNNRDQ